MVRQVLAKSIKLADQVTKASDRAIVNSTTKESIPEIKSKTQKLAALLRQLNSSDLSNSFLGSYNAPLRQILKDIEQNLDRSLSFLLKIKRFRVNFIVLTKIKCCFTTILSGRFPRISLLLECSIRDLLWLLRVIGNREDHYSEIPPIASTEPILLLIWEQIGILSHKDDPLQFRLDAAFTLVGIAGDNDRYATLIIEEDGIEPLLKFIQEGPMEGQENAARTLGLLARGEGVEHMIHEGVGEVFAEILKEGRMKVQAVLAWAVSMLADERPEFQEYFAQNDVVPLLVSHLIIKSNSNNVNVSEDLEIKAEMNAMAAKALWKLAKGNSAICRSLVESKALLSFAMLLENGPEDVQRYSSMALMEITAVVEKDVELKRSVLNPNSPAYKYVVDRLIVKINEQADSELQVPCIRAIGNLASTFGPTGTRIVALLVQLLDVKEQLLDIGDYKAYWTATEACIALKKFACKDNDSHVEHSRAILRAGIAKHLIKFVYFGERIIQFPALFVMCYITLHVLPDRYEELATAEVLIMLHWASKKSHIIQDDTLNKLLHEAKTRLNLFWSRGSRPHLILSFS